MEINVFNQFILLMELVDVPILGKKYIWFSSDGFSRSRIDSILLPNDVVRKWKVSTKWMGDRDVSNHCPMWLMSSHQNWATKPLRFMN